MPTTEMTLDKSNTLRVETDIRPPMRYAITIPVLGTETEGVSVYVAVSPFTACSASAAKELRLIASADPTGDPLKHVRVWPDGKTEVFDA